MAIIRSFNQPTVEAKPTSNVTLPMDAPLGAFGNPGQAEGDAKALLVAGEQLGKASDTTGRIVLAMREEAARLAAEKKAQRL